MQKPIIYSHRGASAYAPENTLSAFRKGIEMGAKGIENDIHLTKDGQIVVCHDADIKRTSNGEGLIKDFTLEELKQFDFGSWFSPEFEGERIPTLEEVLILIKDWEGILNVEIKGIPTLDLPGIEEKLVELVRKYSLTEKVIISSFNHYSLAELKRIAPEFKTAILYSELMYEPWNYVKNIDAFAIHPGMGYLTKEVIEGCKKNGVTVNVWTANEKEHMKMLLDAGVDGIITNCPDIAVELVKQV
jgi:glycerophosphoryl diester phosphodiesterase